LMVRRDRHRTESASQRQAAGVAHEDGGRRGVEPEEREPRADDREQEHGKVAGARNVRDSEIIGELRVADEIGEQNEGEAGDDHRHRRKPIEPVGQVYGIAEGDDHERAEQDVEPAEVGDRLLDERQVKLGSASADHHPGCYSCDEEFEEQARLAGKSGVVRLLHLVVIVEPADQAEAAGHQKAGPHILVPEIHPQQDRDRHRGQDQKTAHGRRAALREVALRTVVANRLTLPLLRPKPADEFRTEQQTDEQCRRARSAGAESDVADEVEDAGKAELVGDQVEHASSFAMLSTSFASPTLLLAFTSTASPARTIRRSASVAPSTLSTRSTETRSPSASSSGRISSPIRISRSTCASSTEGARPAW